MCFNCVKPVGVGRTCRVAARPVYVPQLACLASLVLDVKSSIRLEIRGSMEYPGREMAGYA